MAKNDLQQLVNDTDTSTNGPEFRKELLCSWERGFVENKPTAPSKNLPANLLHRDDTIKSRAALTNPLKGTVVAETSTTVATAAGSIYRKSDLAKSTIPIKRLLNTGLKGNQKKNEESSRRAEKETSETRNIATTIN